MLQGKKIAKLEAKLLVIPEANHETASPTTAVQGLYWIYKTTNNKK
ncbi:hypothetical protein [Pseudoalteromonas sp. A25]|nr:hypothetical protein [Pseudoalteromonas sp. A25]